MKQFMPYRRSDTSENSQDDAVIFSYDREPSPWRNFDRQNMETVITPTNRRSETPEAQTSMVDIDTAKEIAARIFGHYNKSGMGRMGTKDCQRLTNDVQNALGNQTREVPTLTSSEPKMGEEGYREMTRQEIEETAIQMLCGITGQGQNLTGKKDWNSLLEKELYGDSKNQGGQGDKEYENMIQKPEELFDKYDKNKDGFLNSEEFKSMVLDTYRDLKGDGYSRTQNTILEEYFNIMDTSWDNRISKEEFLVFAGQSLRNRDIVF